MLLRNDSRQLRPVRIEQLLELEQDARAAQRRQTRPGGESLHCDPHRVIHVVDGRQYDLFRHNAQARIEHRRTRPSSGHSGSPYPVGDIKAHQGHSLVEGRL